MMSKPIYYFSLFFALATQVASQIPLVTNVELAPLPVITHFGAYEARANVSPNGTNIDSVSVITSVINGEGAEFPSEYYNNGVVFDEASYKRGMTNVGGETYSYDRIRPDDVYPEMFFAPTNVTATNSPVNIQVDRSQYHIMKFVNPFKLVNNSSFFIEVYAEPRSQASIDLQVYLVGSGQSLSFFSSDWRNSPNAELVGTINRSDVFNHTHGPNSKHHLVRLLTNADGTVGNKSIDVNGDFWIVLMAPTPAATRSWDLKYHTKDKNGGRDNDGLVNEALSANATWYRGNSTNWTTTAQSGLPDVHIHLARAGNDGLVDIIDQIGIDIEVEYTYDGPSSTITDANSYPFGEIPNLPPNASALLNPQPCAYSSNFDISWVAATDPNGDAITYNVYLLDAVTGNQIDEIATGISATSIEQYDISAVSAGFYDIKVEACDAQFCTPFFWSGRYGNIGDYIYIGAAGSLFRSTTNGSWSNNSVWEKNSSNCGWVPAGALEYPGAAQNAYVSFGHEIELGVANYSPNIYIDGTLSAASGLAATNVICEIGSVIKCGGNWDVTNFTPTLSEVIFNGNGTFQIESSNTFYNITIKNDSEITTPTLVTTNVLGVLTVEAKGILKQAAGSTIEIAGRLNLASSPTVNATYLPGGTLTIAPDSVLVQQVINNPGHTYSLAVPVSGATASSIGINNGIYTWDNPNGTWAAVASEDVLQPGVGYICRSSNGPLLLSGAINAIDINVPLSRSLKGFGWNMVGNPFTASINWNSLGIGEEAAIDNSFWMWLMPDDVYGTYNGLTELGTNGVTSLIPSNHSFFVKVKEGVESTSLNLTSAALVKNETTYLKSSCANPVIDYIRISAYSEFSTDEAIVAFVEDDTPNLQAYSSEKRFANSANSIEVFSLNASKRNAINSLVYKNKMTVPLGFNVQKAGYYYVSIQSLLANRYVSLFDFDEDEVVLDGGDDLYKFYVDKKMVNESKFLLIFSDDVITRQTHKTINDGLKCYVNNGRIFLEVKEEQFIKWITISDITGQLLFSNSNYETGVHSLGIYNPGLYIIKAMTKCGVAFVQKVVVTK